jgi:hypothetical protein
MTDLTWRHIFDIQCGGLLMTETIEQRPSGAKIRRSSRLPPAVLPAVGLAFNWSTIRSAVAVGTTTPTRREDRGVTRSWSVVAWRCTQETRSKQTVKS